MQLNTLSISQLRNINEAEIHLNPRFNIFYGENGHGKTTVLEAVSLLSTGRSFRATRSKQMISFGTSECRVFGIACAEESEQGLGLIRLGIERSQGGGIKMRLAEQDCHSIAELARTLPTQLINSDSYAILESSPKFRRQYLDWVMFHVEPSFYLLWQRFNRALQQRNAALKLNKYSNAQSIRAWDSELIESGVLIDTMRRTILQELAELFYKYVQRMLNTEANFTICYQSGWASGKLYQDELDMAFDKDRLYGYTTLGPQRADLDFLVDNYAVKSVLSRGQSKLFICALLLARAELLFLKQERRCVFLIDDLNSELDAKASQFLIQALCNLKSQVLITCIEKDPLAKLIGNQEYSSYHLKSGIINSD